MAWLHPHFLWTLALAVVALVLFAWAARRRRRAFQLLGNPTLVERLTTGYSPTRRRWKEVFVVLGVLLLALALVGPRVGTQLRELKREGIDLVIALDVSTSMQAE